MNKEEVPPAAGTAGALMPLVYEELRHLAAAKLAMERPGQTLQATALVHEAWLRVVGESKQQWENRQHFFAVAAEAMRRILVDRARRRHSAKHGGHHERVPLDDIELPDTLADETVLQVHAALDELAADYPAEAEIVKLKMFIGLTNDEAATLLQVNEKTIRRRWEFAKALLYRAMTGGEQPGH